MKTRRITAIIAVFVLIAALSVSAFAAELKLPNKPNWVNLDPQQQGWATDGAECDQPTANFGLTAEQVQAATKLVIELNTPVFNDDIKMGVKTENLGWLDWDATPYMSADKLKIEVDLTKDANWQDKIVKDEFAWCAFMIQAWNDNWIDIKNAYLEVPGTVATTPASGGGSSNPKTGDDFTVFLAIGALALAGVCGFFFARKARNNA